MGIDDAVWKRKRQREGVPAPSRRLNILLTNGRFPVSIDMARQLKLAGHIVFTVDPMKFHVCRFSNSVTKSYKVPVPHMDGPGYIKGVRKAIDDRHIDLVIPMHEEIFYLTECDDQEILTRLFAPPFRMLIRLHNKWEFCRFLTDRDLDVPKHALCRNKEDIQNLDQSVEWALKPVYGRAATKVYHLKPEKPLPEDIDVSEENHYIAQEWLYGNRYCSYAVVRKGKTRAFSLYPVEDTIDGSSCVYFKNVEHPRIREYVERIVNALGSEFQGQLAFDFIETEDGRLVAIECNPRATSGIHLFSGTTLLARAITGDTDLSEGMAPNSVHPPPGARRQVAPGMLMFRHSKLTPAGYLKHLARLIFTKDVTFQKTDIMPSLMQPFLLTSYYTICWERHMKLADMFQWDLTWEPDAEKLEKVRKMIAEPEPKENIADAGRPATSGDVVAKVDEAIQVG